MYIYNSRTVSELVEYMNGLDVNATFKEVAKNEGMRVVRLQWDEERYNQRTWDNMTVRLTTWIVAEGDKIISFREKLKSAKHRIGIKSKKPERIIRCPDLIERDRMIRQDGLEAGDSSFCTVRSFANLTGLSFKEAAEWCELHGRQKGGGMMLHQIRRLLKDAGIKYEDLTKEVREKAKTLKSFDRAGFNGKWMLITATHASSAIDGNVLDGESMMNLRITHAWKFPENCD